MVGLPGPPVWLVLGDLAVGVCEQLPVAVRVVCVEPDRAAAANGTVEDEAQAGDAGVVDGVAVSTEPGPSRAVQDVPT